MMARVRVTFSCGTHHFLAVLPRWSRVHLIEGGECAGTELVRVGWVIQPAWREGLGTSYGPIIGRYATKREAIEAKRRMLAAEPREAWLAASYCYACELPEFRNSAILDSQARARSGV